MKYKYKKVILPLFFVICLIILLVIPYFVFADPFDTTLEATNPTLKKLKSVGDAGGYQANVSETTFAETLGKIVNAALSLLGVIFVILIVLAGYNWMTAAGDEAKVTKAKESIRRAIIGFIIVASAFAIYNFIFVHLLYAS